MSPATDSSDGFEVHVNRIHYPDGDFVDQLSDLLEDDEEPAIFHLDVFIDDNEVREPYLIRAPLTLFDGDPEWDAFDVDDDSFDWTIDRAWPCEESIRFEAWVQPIGLISDDVDAPYNEYETKIGDTVIDDSATAGSTIIGLDKFYLDYDIEDLPEADSHRTPMIQSAMDDFEKQSDEGISNIDKDDFVDTLDLLSSRVETDGSGDQGVAGYPHGAVDLLVQGVWGICGTVALAVHMTIERPRQLIELGRSIYQSMAVHTDGQPLHGFSTRWSTMIYSEAHFVGSYRTYSPHEQSDDDTFPDVDRDEVDVIVQIILWEIRRSLANLPMSEYPSPRKEYDSSEGMVTAETLAVAREVIGEADASPKLNINNHDTEASTRRRSGRSTPRTSST